MLRTPNMSVSKLLILRYKSLSAKSHLVEISRLNKYREKQYRFLKTDLFFFAASNLVVGKYDHSDYLTEFGELVTKYRKAQKLTKVQLAFEIGANESSIRKIEKGKQNVTLGVLIRLAAALNIEPRDLLPPRDLSTPSKERQENQ